MSDDTPVQRLRAQQKALFDAVVKRYDTNEGWRFAINLALVVGGGVFVGLGKLPGFTDTAKSWMSGIGLVMVFLGGIIVAVFDRKRVALTTSAKDALELAQEFLDQQSALDARIEAADTLDTRRRFLLGAITEMQEAVERMPLDHDIVTVIGAMVDAATGAIDGAIGFAPGERWTFSIFRCEPLKPGSAVEVMRRIAVISADRTLEKGVGREWLRNEGFTGVSWHTDREVIESNLNDPEVAKRYPVPRDKQRDGDAKRYVSVAVIPIRVGANEGMWGSVTATSDRMGRWGRAAADANEHNVTTVQMLAQLIATQVALRDKAV